MTHEEKDKLMAQQAAELEALRKKNAELEAKNKSAEEEVAAANAAAEAANAELEAQKAAAQNKTADNCTAAPKREKIFIPRAAHSKDDPNLVVGFNGKLYVLPRGKESEVPVEVAEEIRRSWRAAERYEKTREQKLEEVAQAEAQMQQKIN